ncbi:MAG: hypothetical protein HRT54_12805 [Colwellia sp.]|nr:hypothetical protein [Colwellia sp.]
MLAKLFNNNNMQFPKLILGLSNRLDNDYVTRVLLFSFLFLCAMAIVLIPGYYFDDRVLNNYPIWAKPIKFSIALAMHFLTLTILAQQLKLNRRTGLLLTFFVYMSVISMIFEQGYITIQAARGHHSHFNLDTPFEALMFNFMGIGAVNLILVSFVLGILIWKYGKKDSTGLRLGSILGLTLGSLLTLIYAMTMGNSPSHLVGEAINNSKVPILGWSREVGDLRIPHFIATHMMQVLPLLGFILDKYKFAPKIIVVISTLMMVGMSALFFNWALLGKSIF